MIEDLVRGRGYLALGTRLRRIGERLQAETQTILAAHGLTIQSSQYPVLAALAANGPLTIGNIALALGVSQPGVTRLVGQLAKAGMVRTDPGEDDQRQKVVSLTEAGARVIEVGQNRVWPIVNAILSDMLDTHQGPILVQLDHLEDELQRRSFLQRTGVAQRGKGR